MTETEIWDKAITIIKREIDSPIAFRMYIENTSPLSLSNGIFRLEADNELCRTMIQKRYKELIERCLFAAAGEQVRLELTSAGENEQPSSHEDSSKIQTAFTNSLNPKYTFDNYVVGAAQNYAYSVSLNAARQPGINYNPLFLYGRSGLGKTHLMQAIGNEMLRIDPSKKILYVTSERFTNDLINSIRDKNTESFRQLYRDVDALLIDDVQFIQGKENVQEEFFHTFNDLHEKRKQIVITSDRKPKELVVLEERLRNRFEWGLIQDIMLPDFETRVAILKKKLQSQKVDINDNVLEYIAQRINTNIRELEGALTRLTAFAGISGRRIDIPFAESVLQDLFPEDIKITTKKVIEKVCSYYKITEKEITGTSRNSTVVVPRQVAMYLCKTLTDLNYVIIGHDFGNKDRTTVMHNVDKIAKQIKTDQKLKSDIEFIKNDLQSL